MDGVLRVLKEMKNAGVNPDSQTFGYLISNCSCEEDIIKVVLCCIAKKRNYIFLSHTALKIFVTLFYMLLCDLSGVDRGLVIPSMLCNLVIRNVV